MRTTLPTLPRRAVVATGVVSALLVGGLLAVAPVESPPTYAAGPTLTCASDPSLLNTGYDGEGGRLLSGADAQWQVADGGDNPDPSGVTWADATLVSNPSSRWTTSPYNNASWISYSTTGLHDQNRYFFFRYSFVLDPSVKASAFSVSLDFFADNSVQDIWVNGISQAPTLSDIPQTTVAPHDYLGYYAENAARTTLDRDWRAGQNEVVVRVDTSAPNVGFLAQTTSNGFCADFRDGPTSYRTSRDDDGPSHIVAGTTRAAAPLTLGRVIDVEGGPAAVDGSGDDGQGVDDEDAVASFPPLTTLTDAYLLEVSVRNDTADDATLAGWIDFDCDGAFEASELAVAAVPMRATSVSLQWSDLRPIECSSFARFRLYSGLDPDIRPVGEVTGGEVEDYPVTIASAGLVVNKIADRSVVNEGDELTYTITIHNPAEVVASAARIKDDLADVLTDAIYLSGSADIGTYDYRDGVATWSGDLQPRQTATVTITVQIRATPLGDRFLTNTVVDESRPDTPTGNCPLGSAESACVWPVVAGPAFDFGDAPASYGTVRASSGAIHALRGYDASANTASLMIGSLVDAEADAPASDEATAAPDEDGVHLEPLAADDGEYRVTVNVVNRLSQPATLAGWVDFDGNGTFDSDERAVRVVDPGSAQVELVWDEVTPVAGQSESRFRIVPGSGSDPQPTGLVNGGEVEDYRLVVAAAVSVPTGGSTLAFTGSGAGGAPLLALAFLLLGGVALGGARLAPRRRPRH